MIYPLDQLKPKTKIKNKIFFAGLNENSTTFLHTLGRGTRKQKGKKTIFLNVYNKVEMLLIKNLVFIF